MYTLINIVKCIIRLVYTLINIVKLKLSSLGLGLFSYTLLLLGIV